MRKPRELVDSIPIRCLALCACAAVASVLPIDADDQPKAERRGTDRGESGNRHWAWQEPVRSELPHIDRTDWAQNPIDYFVLARLEQQGLTPAPEADRYTLGRRVHLDLIGLPPSPQELDQFVSDPRPDAYERLVDRLLADPAFGERWARMWLDLARYADSKGYGSDPLRTIWRYRDWVIDAFNRNLPYDRFTIEQIAGDLLPHATQDQILATAFHRNTMTNDEGGTDDELFRVEAIKDRVDTTMQVWMGVTFGCAKCHSHKFDPFTQREYYQLFAFFNQTEDADRNDEEPKLATPSPEQRAEVERLKSEISNLKSQLDATTPELAAAQAKWEQAIAAASAQWVVLEPAEFRAANGTSFEKLPDQSLLARGGGPDTDTDTIVARTQLKGISAIRLEALTHESLPGNGPGRQPVYGNFVLNDLRVTASGGEDKPVGGRFVRIEIPGQQKILSLAEVQVFVQARGGPTAADDPSPPAALPQGERGENVAVKGKATQSSTDYDGPAQLAIDGNTNGHYFDAKSTTHTRQEDNPWWELDLGGPVAIARIVIWNRTDGGPLVQNRLSNFRVTVLDESRTPVWQAAVADSPKPSTELALTGPMPIVLQNPTADFAQNGWPVTSAIDADAGPASGWAVGPQSGKQHTAVFETARPVGSDGETTLVFTLVQSHGTQHTIGRLRLSVTTLAPPPRALPGNISDILAVAAADRSAEQSAELARYFRSIAPELKATRDRIAQLDAQLKAVEKQIPTTPILRDLPPEKRRATHVLIKSNFLLKGEPVESGVPAALHPLCDAADPPAPPPVQRAAEPAPTQVNTPLNRLDLARWLVHPANPLTARVAANRFWSQLFGRGLVETEEDFGTQGLPPSHPELLDWLAVEFAQCDSPTPHASRLTEQSEEEGSRGVGEIAAVRAWDIKALLRLIVTSATYRQTSIAAPELLRKDPDNRLLARGPRHRLEAEMVRDQALALAGLLSRKIGGPSVYPPQPPGLWRAAFNSERTWATSTGDDRYRRGLYTFWRRTVPYPSMATFDAPSREICTIRRFATNTPLQAFVTLNDPAYVEAAQALARRIVREGGSSVEDRAAFALKLCLCRPPAAEQVAEIVSLYRTELEHYRSDAAAAQHIATDPLGPIPPGTDATELAAWTVVANVLLNLDGVLAKR